MKLITTFCPPSDPKPFCPQLFIDYEAASDQRVVIRDDWGYEVRMNPEQFSEMIIQAESVKKELNS